MTEQFVPNITTELRKDIVRVPDVIRKASGIHFFGKKIRSIIFTTDIAIIRNTNADAVIAVYPFTPHPAITKSIIEAADIPVFSGVGGGLTQGQRSQYMSMFAEAQGSIGVVLNAPTPVETVEQVCQIVDIPVISTVTSKYTPIDEKIAVGIKVINISAGKETAETVRHFRKHYPELPIIATGGPTAESILETIQAGANAITYTPPSNGELFSRKMEHYRDLEKNDNE
ncbi:MULTISPECIES: beta/alpha barrel domain-containing protein [Enterococcus]|uniref:hydrolase n=1 Tax=Enterococcus TaxID=1350 RepID=UPI00065E67EB|nr:MULTISPECIES: hydrolase [Enterococcus]KAF1304747.1 hydrolase [Enterococcus sp. JM9B]